MISIFELVALQENRDPRNVLPQVDSRAAKNYASLLQAELKADEDHGADFVEDMGGWKNLSSKVDAALEQSGY
jgi:hypothetical protein